LPSTRAMPDRDVFNVAAPVRSNRPRPKETKRDGRSILRQTNVAVAADIGLIQLDAHGDRL
jgi:hypothetical protein